jgi:hypothetical protein
LARAESRLRSSLAHHRHERSRCRAGGAGGAGILLIFLIPIAYVPAISTFLPDLLYGP